jgi:heparan-alpha-glucosaminide N-acetyltransferase
MNESATLAPPGRLVSLDAYRGLTMLAMASGGLGLHAVANNVNKERLAEHLPASDLWNAVGYQFEHVDWVGCSLWDLIQPSFMFMVGVAMAYSAASRAAHGQSYAHMLRHAVVRSIVLVLLGVFLRSDGRPQANFTFEDVLSQIGLGYTFLFLLWGRPIWVQLGAAIAILVAYWCFFFFYPLPDPEFDYGSVGVASNWPHLQGMAAHWDKNTNAAAWFDQWFLNLFPRKKPFVYNGGGYLTLSFIPSLATMIFGLLAGELLRGPRTSKAKFWILIGAGVLGLASGELLGATGICPIVKRIWTPSWALFSTGWTCLFLAGFFGVVDILKFRWWTFPLIVVGMNSITMYCMEELSHGWFFRTIKTHTTYIVDYLNQTAWVSSIKEHLPEKVLHLSDKIYEPFFWRLWVLMAMWAVCYWLYRQKIFIRI